MRVSHLTIIGAATLLAGSVATSAALDLGAGAESEAAAAQSDTLDTAASERSYEIELDDGTTIVVDEAFLARLTDATDANCAPTSGQSVASESSIGADSAASAEDGDTGDGDGDDIDIDIVVEGDTDSTTPAGGAGSDTDVGTDANTTIDVGDLLTGIDPSALLAGLTDVADLVTGTIGGTGSMDTPGIVVDADEDQVGVGLDGDNGLIEANIAGIEIGDDDLGLGGILPALP